jgi:hypothetical protein
MAGMAFVTFRKLASDMLAKARMPARISSLFLIEVPSLTLRCFNSSSLRYSSFGMVKLSRTSFGFLAFSSLTSVDFVAAVTAVLVCAFTAVFTAGVAATVGVVLTTDLTAALGTALGGALGGAFLAVGLTATLAAGLAGSATFFAGVLGALFATALAAARVGAAGSDGAGAALLAFVWSAGAVVGSVAASACMVDVMVSCPEVKRGK